MHYVLILLYFLVLIVTIGRILLNTQSTPKTLAYLLLVLVFPVAGIIFYYAFGINFRHRKSKSAMEISQQTFDIEFFRNANDETKDLLAQHAPQLGQYTQLVCFLHQIGGEFLSKNYFKLLQNGEAKFPEVLKTLHTAQNFIHMEYYDWENDTRGNQIKDVLLKKAADGVQIRILYDDYASRKIEKNIVKELKDGGVSIYPKIKVKLKQVANRMNHRDHRKVIIVDGIHGFVGGINISDRYDNTIETGLWWRDTHVKVTGHLVHSLQRHFLISWNSSQPNAVMYSSDLFPNVPLTSPTKVTALAQVVAGGPVYRLSNIMLTYFKIFSLAKESLYITNPYFIPNESILDALRQAALSGVDVRILVPEKSDSTIVGLAANSYFQDLLPAGVRIFLYRKGFVHAKTVVADKKLSVVGTANMDLRSFDLNFEIMSVIYSEEFAGKMEDMFMSDLEQSNEIDKEKWSNRGIRKRLLDSIARLVSAFL